MYVLRLSPYGQTLTEVTAREYLRAQEVDRNAYRRVDAEFARRYVKNGGHHETALWVDTDGKVRYARDCN